MTPTEKPKRSKLKIAMAGAGLVAAGAAATPELDQRVCWNLNRLAKTDVNQCLAKVHPFSDNPPQVIYQSHHRPALVEPKVGAKK